MTLHTLARTCGVLFAVSTAFPLVASVLEASRRPRWLGITDVGIAALLVGVAAIVAARGRAAVTDRHRLAAFRISQRVIGLIPALLAAYFIVGSRVDWTVLVIGFVWRGWLFLYTLPFLIAVVATTAPGRAEWATER